MENALNEQQRMFIKQGSLDTKKIGFYIMALPADELANLCVIHIMRFLLNNFVKSDLKDGEKEDLFHSKSIECKMVASQIFQELGSLVDKQLKSNYMDKTQLNKLVSEDSIGKHLLIDDYAIGQIPKAMQIKIGAYLTNIMILNLKYRCGDQNFMLLKTQLIKGDNTVNTAKGKIYKKIGTIVFNKGFVEEF
jgi:hypothetical protein